MGNQEDNQFKWWIKDFTSSKCKIIYSDQFVIGGYKWQILAYPKGKKNSHHYLWLDLELAGCESLPSGWRREVKYSFTIVNHLSQELSKQIGYTEWFDQKERCHGVPMVNLSEFKDTRCGFQVDGQVQIVAQIHVYENVRKSYIPEDPEMATTFSITKKPNNGGAVSSDAHQEIPAHLVYVNGFQVLPSQVGFVRRIFEKHPETALECCTKNHDLRTSYINVLFILIKMLYKGSQEHSTDDLSDAAAALAYMKNVGFKLDWLEKKLDEVKENTKKCAQVTELVQQLQGLMNQFTGVHKQLEKVRGDIKKATPPDLSFNDFL